MAAKPDNQYEYRVCPMCEKQKKILTDENKETLWDHDEWIMDKGNTYLKNPKYHPLCIRCCSNELRSDFKIAMIEIREERGIPVPQWLRDS